MKIAPMNYDHKTSWTRGVGTVALPRLHVVHYRNNFVKRSAETITEPRR